MTAPNQTDEIGGDSRNRRTPRSRRGWGEGRIVDLADGRCRVVLSSGKDPVTGKRVRATKTFTNKTLALQWQASKRGQGAGGGAWTVKGWVDHWHASTAPTVSPRTAAGYLEPLASYVVPHLGLIKLGGLTVVRVQKWYQDLTAAKVPAATQARAGRMLRMVLKAAVDQDVLVKSVAAKVKLPRYSPRDMVCLNEAEARQFLAANAGDGWAAYWRLALDAGCRPGEMFALRWHDVDFGPGVLHVRRALERLNDKTPPREKPPKTKKGIRSILLAASTVAALTAHRTAQQKAGAYNSRGLLFPAEDGQHFRTNSFNKWKFKPACKRAGPGFPAIRPYDLRHTSATLLLSRGVNVKVVSERLGHESIEITLKHYAHVLPTMQEAARAAADSLYGDRPENGTNLAHGGDTTDAESA